MKKHRNKIIAAVVVVALLAGTWLISGSYDNDDATFETAPDAPVSSGDTGLAPTVSPEDSADDNLSTSPAIAVEVTETPAGSPTVTDEPTPTDAPSATPAETDVPTQDINPETGRDKYQTAPVPDGKPLPVEPEDMVVGDGSFTVTLSVRCDTLLDNMDRLDKEKHELVPEDGVIFAAQAVTVYEGESVFNVLQREMRRAKIHMEFVNTPIYNSAYIEGINNLYEFDGGELSGWMYKVNGWFPNYGCSRYLLQPGDVVEWIYTCDLGRDIGGEYAVGGNGG